MSITVACGQPRGAALTGNMPGRKGSRRNLHLENELVFPGVSKIVRAYGCLAVGRLMYA